MRILPIQLRRVFVTLGIAVVTVSSVSASPQPDDRHGQTSRCARQFEKAQRIDMESFRDYDAEAFKDGHHPDAVTIFASGAVRHGIDAIMTALASHFANREAVWAWTEMYRIVDGCNSAFILYDTTYDIPSAGFHQHALTGVTYTYKHGKWLSIADQGTLLPQ